MLFETVGKVHWRIGWLMPWRKICTQHHSHSFQLCSELESFTSSLSLFSTISRGGKFNCCWIRVNPSWKACSQLTSLQCNPTYSDRSFSKHILTTKLFLSQSLLLQLWLFFSACQWKQWDFKSGLTWTWIQNQVQSFECLYFKWMFWRAGR